MKSEKLFENMKPYLVKQAEDVKKKVGFVYAFEVFKNKGDAPETWTVNLKDSVGISKGKVGTVDATFNLSDDDAVALFGGSLNPQTAFMQGKLKIKGNMQAAMKFTPELFPKDAKL
jgi:putative sterol carrier protein